MFFLGATANIFAYLLASTFFIACFCCNVTVNHQKIIHDIPPVHETYADKQEYFQTNSTIYIYDSIINNENTSYIEKKFVSSNDFRDTYIKFLYTSYPLEGNTLRAPPYL